MYIYTHKLKCMQNKQIQAVSKRILLLTAVQLLMSAKQHCLVRPPHPHYLAVVRVRFSLNFVCVWKCSHALHWICLLDLLFSIFLGTNVQMRAGGDNSCCLNVTSRACKRETHPSPATFRYLQVCSSNMPKWRPFHAHSTLKCKV